MAIKWIYCSVCRETFRGDNLCSHLEDELERDNALPERKVIIEPMEIKDKEIDIIIPTLKPLSSEVKSQIDEIEANTLLPHKIIATCQPLSAAQNRNLGLDIAQSKIVIMLDDDITGFWKGWATELIKPLLEDKMIYVVSARALKPDLTPGPMCGVVEGEFEVDEKGYIFISKRKDVVLPSMAIAFRNTDIRFDETYKGSGYEDTDYYFSLAKKYPNCKFVVNNNCKLVHLHEKKNQDKNFIFNRDYFYKKWGLKNIDKPLS